MSAQMEQSQPPAGRAGEELWSGAGATAARQAPPPRQEGWASACSGPQQASTAAMSKLLRRAGGAPVEGSGSCPSPPLGTPVAMFVQASQCNYHGEWRRMKEDTIAS